MGFALVAAGLLLLNGGLIAMAIPALLLGVIRVLPVSRAPDQTLHFERLPVCFRHTEGDRLDVELTVTNMGSSIALLSLTDKIPVGPALVDGYPHVLGRIASRETKTISYSISLSRGVHSLDKVCVRAWSPWRLAMSESHISLPATVTVQPHVHDVGFISIRPRRTRAFAGPVKANRGGQGLDFFGCRAYAPGDDIRRINWRAYARQESMIVNEYELERIADVNVVLDARARSHTQLDGETTFDHSVRAAASLASHFLHQGNNVGLLVYGEYLQWVYPGTGRSKRNEIFDTLAVAKLSDRAAFEELRFIPTRLLPPRSQLVLVSPLVEENDIEVVALLVDRGYSVLLACPHSLEIGTNRRRPADTHAIALARRILDLKRQLFLGSLAAIGTTVIDWDVAEPFRSACQRIHYSRVRRYHT